MIEVRTRKIKDKKCKYSKCRKLFTPSPFRPLQSCCSILCAVKYAEELIQKKEKQSWRKRKKILKEKTKSYGDYIQELQKIFNEFIRLRDKDQPCISCGRTQAIQWHAGHFYPVSAHPSVRFDEENVWKQDSQCNDYLSGNLVKYRENLIQKIGLERFEALTVRANQTTLKLTISEIDEMKAKYREKIRALKIK